MILHTILFTSELSFKNLNPGLLTMWIFIYFILFFKKISLLLKFHRCLILKAFQKISKQQFDLQISDGSIICLDAFRSPGVCPIKLDSQPENLEEWPDGSHSSSRNRIDRQKFFDVREGEETWRGGTKEANQIPSQYKKECSHDRCHRNGTGWQKKLMSVLNETS